MAAKLGTPIREAIGDDLLLLFGHGTRPTVGQVRTHQDIVGYADGQGPDIAEYQHPVDIAAPNGIVLLRAGLTFDLVGLAPGPAIPVPDMGQGERLERAAARSRVEASSLRLGPHIAAGRRSLAVLREWFALAAVIASKLDAFAISWVPGGVVTPTDMVGPTLNGSGGLGDVPVPLLADFRPTIDGAIQSIGLSYFTGQEFRIEPPLRQHDVEALARLIFTHLFYAGSQQETSELAAPDGHALRLEPSANGRIIRVWPG